MNADGTVLVLSGPDDSTADAVVAELIKLNAPTVRDSCGGGRTCPNINMTDRGTYVVQGYLVADLDLGSDVLVPGEVIVEVPLSLLPELADDKTVRYTARRTSRGTILVRGRSVVDPEALRKLNLPVGEAAVEIPISALPQLEIAHAR